MIITSKDNEKVKFVRSLNDKKFRQKNNAYYLEGIKVTCEILEKEAISVMFIAYSSEILCDEEYILKISEKCKKNNILMYDIKKEVFESMCETVTPQGILCVLKIKSYDISKCLEKSYDNVFILDSVQDLGNIGTILRNAKAFDIKNVICLNGTADIYNQKCLRSTMGTILDLNIIYEKDSKKVLEILKSYNYNIVGTSLNTNKKISELDFDKKYAFVLGNEANGVSDEILNNCDEKIKLEMNETLDSLNVSVASGIIGYIQYINKK